MNRLITPNGGFPLTNDALHWIQNGIKEGIAGLLNQFTKYSPLGFPAQQIILAGCEVTQGPTTYSTTEGYILLDGEVLYAPPVTGRANALLPLDAYALEVTYDPSGFVTFQDGVQRNTHEIRRARIFNFPSTPSFNVVPVGIPINRLVNLLTFADVWSPNRITEADISFLNDWVPEPLSLDENILITKQFGRVMMRGRIESGVIDNSGWTTALELPPGFRPKTLVSFVLNLGTIGGICQARILGDGKLQVHEIIAGSGPLIDLSSISFSTE